MSAALSYSAPPYPSPVIKTVGWYCLRVIARREHITARNLEQRTGVPVFAAGIRVRRESRHGPGAWITEALFPGYLFARFGYPHEARHVTSTPGVLALVAFGGPPPVVTDAVIDHLATEVRRAAALPAHPGFTAGAWVRIVTGCFRGSEGRVTHDSGSATRTNVLLTLLGQDIQVSVPADQLQQARDYPDRIPTGLRAPAAASTTPSR
jgi:transcriptional antiterminator RfaH